MGRQRVRKMMIVLLAVALLAGGGYWWASRPLELQHPVVDVQITPGESASAVAVAVVDSGVRTSPLLLEWWLRLAGDATSFKAGSYEIRAGETPRTLLRKLSRGEFAMRRVRLGEGWTFKQVRAALAKAEALKQGIDAMSDAELMAALGRPGQNPEGLFFPDTYKYNKNSPDLDVLKLAMRTMDRKLEAAWQSRASDSPLQTPYDMLKLASIVEKETGHGPDRALVAAVFSNRLKIGMRLQTDPTVIYGMGDKYQGNIRRRDLDTDTPYNTYTRAGLPPTPIALPGEAALAATANPAESDALYFVARGDGSSEFSKTLDAHNRAVNKFIQGRN